MPMGSAILDVAFRISAGAMQRSVPIECLEIRAIIPLTARHISARKAFAKTASTKIALAIATATVTVAWKENASITQLFVNALTLKLNRIAPFLLNAPTINALMAIA